MPAYENAADREQQYLAAYQYEKHLQRLGVTPVRCVHTPESRKESHDVEAWVHGKWTTVLEIKCRRVTSDQVEKWGSLLVEVERLARLKAAFRKSSLDGRGYWSKEIVFLWRCVNDDSCFAIHIDAIVDAWDTLEDAPAEMMKDNHGEQGAAKRGKLVPITLMERFK